MKTNDPSINGGLMKLDPASMTAIKQVHKTENEKAFSWVTDTDNWCSFSSYFEFCIFRRFHRKLGFDGHVKNPRVSTDSLHLCPGWLKCSIVYNEVQLETKFKLSRNLTKGLLSNSFFWISILRLETEKWTLSMN